MTSDLQRAPLSIRSMLVLAGLVLGAGCGTADPPILRASTPDQAAGGSSGAQAPPSAPSTPAPSGGALLACPVRGGSGVVGGACTEMGCYSGFHVELTPGDHWPRGHYRFEMVADGQTMTCEGDLPLRACDAGPSLRCDGSWATISESGCALAPSDHGFSDISVDGHCPTDVRITISRDGQQIATTQVQPSYRDVAPNGVSCGPICRQAAATLPVR